MRNKNKANQAAPSLEQFLASVDENLRDLFIKVMNLHAGFQIVERSPKQLVDAVRNEIENSLSEQKQSQQN